MFWKPLVWKDALPDSDYGETYQGTGNYSMLSSVHLNNIRKHETGSPFSDKAEKGLSIQAAPVHQVDSMVYFLQH